MSKFEIEYEGRYLITSKVYAIDTRADRFLIVDEDGYFKWVHVADCRLHKEEE